jgi:hypothetical protein
MILPIVNNNGTGRDELIEQRRNVSRAINEALDALRLMYPHGRDYQTDPTGEQYKQAQEQHDRRLKALVELNAEILAEARALYRSEDKK